MPRLQSKTAGTVNRSAYHTKHAPPELELGTGVSKLQPVGRPGFGQVVLEYSHPFPFRWTLSTTAFTLRQSSVVVVETIRPTSLQYLLPDPEETVCPSWLRT